MLVMHFAGLVSHLVALSMARAPCIIHVVQCGSSSIPCTMRHSFNLVVESCTLGSNASWHTFDFAGNLHILKPAQCPVALVLIMAKSDLIRPSSACRASLHQAWSI
ncbi:unnamed protein product [Effrenium voratum]|uniref:Secreted protein n=1 Tax=Effrenium voratum TaxID=2562239 RepID=A0AA36MH96_9DINO|nr:unnamed protein product [Effrenium voratum]CAJ1422286.1 unnamed protein product [Effrenium voratum]